MVDLESPLDARTSAESAGAALEAERKLVLAALGEGGAAGAGGTVPALVIGPFPPPFGGTTVSFASLVHDLEAAAGVTVVEVVDTRADAAVPRLVAGWRLLRLMASTVRGLPVSRVVLVNASNRRAVVFGAFVALCAALLGRGVVLRVFGGELHAAYEQGGVVFRSCARLVFARCLVLLQTRELVRFFRSTFPRGRILWFPTSRALPAEVAPREDASSPPARETRFLFAGKICPEKGVDTLLAVFSGLEEAPLALDLCGAVEPADAAWWRSVSRALPARVRYLGCLEPERLRPAMTEYDCLLLPTRWHNEGYPGAIIEAFAAGLPVIASDCGPIAEIVDGTCGLLVAATDLPGWRDAVLRVAGSGELRRRLRAGARERAQLFDAAFWQREIMVRVLRAAAAGREPG